MKTSATLSTTAVAAILCAHAIAQTSGTSHPELLDDNLNAAPVPAATDHYIPPSHAAAPTTTQTSTPAPVAGFTAIGEPTAVAPGTPMPRHRAEPVPAVTDDLDSGIVAAVPVGPDELAATTILKATLGEDISTRETLAGTRFTAVLSQDVGHEGRVLLPAGAVIHGRITQIHGGKRIGGAAAIRLQPDSVTLPDGTAYRIAAEVVDLDHFQDSHVNSEGTIVANGHPRTTAAALGLTTGSAVIAGAVIGGGVGAAVGLGVGAGIGAVWWLKQDRQQLLPAGTEIVLSLDSPLQLTPAVR
jgi:hypothetical protein